MTAIVLIFMVIPSLASFFYWLILLEWKLNWLFVYLWMCKLDKFNFKQCILNIFSFHNHTFRSDLRIYWVSIEGGPLTNFIIHAGTGRNYYLKKLKQKHISFWYKTVDLLAVLKLQKTTGFQNSPSLTYHPFCPKIKWYICSSIRFNCS